MEKQFHFLANSQHNINMEVNEALFQTMSFALVVSSFVAI